MTLYNVPDSVLKNIEMYLAFHRNVKFSTRLQPSDSVRWTVENERNLSGFVDMRALQVGKDGTIYIKKNTLVLEKEPEDWPVAIKIQGGKVSVTIRYDQVENLGMVHDIEDSSMTEVSEITFLE